MTTSPKVLGDGQLPGTLGDLYTVGTGKSAIIRCITLTNKNTVTETTMIYVLKLGSTARLLTPNNFRFGADYKATIDDILTLAEGDKIQGVTTTGSKVDYQIHGVEQ